MWVPGGLVCQKSESVWMGLRREVRFRVQVRVESGPVHQKPGSVWICSGGSATGGGKSMHYRGFGTPEGLLPACGGSFHAWADRASMHYRRFGARRWQAPAHGLRRGLPGDAGASPSLVGIRRELPGSPHPSRSLAPHVSCRSFLPPSIPVCLCEFQRVASVFGPLRSLRTRPDASGRVRDILRCADKREGEHRDL